MGSIILAGGFLNPFHGSVEEAVAVFAFGALGQTLFIEMQTMPIAAHPAGLARRIADH